MFAGDIVAAVGLKFTTTGDTLTSEPHDNPIGQVHRLPRPGDRGRHRAQDQVRPGQDDLRHLAPRRGGPYLPGPHRRGHPARPSWPAWAKLHLEVLVDQMLREFKVDASVGRPQVAYQETIRTCPTSPTPREADRRQGPMPPTSSSTSSRRRRRRRVRVRQQDRRRQGAPEYIPSVDAGIQDAMSSGVLRRLSHGRPARDPARRVLPRGRLLGDGVQDRRLDGAQGAARRGPARRCWSRSWTSRWSRRRVRRRRDGRPVGPARAYREDGPAAARSSGPPIPWRRCSATPPTCVRSAGPGHDHALRPVRRRCRRTLPRRPSSRRFAGAGEERPPPWRRSLRRTKPRRTWDDGACRSWKTTLTAHHPGVA